MDAIPGPSSRKRKREGKRQVLAGQNGSANNHADDARQDRRFAPERASSSSSGSSGHERRSPVQNSKDKNHVFKAASRSPTRQTSVPEHRGARAAMMELDRRAAAANAAAAAERRRTEGNSRANGRYRGQHNEQDSDSSSTSRDDEDSSSSNGEDTDADTRATDHSPSSPSRQEVTTLRAEKEALEAKVALLEKGAQYHQEVIDSQRQALTYLHGQATCNICFELIWRPQVLNPCGHTFCARCLVDWFTRPSPSTDMEIADWMPESEQNMIRITNNHKRTKLCPHCRARIVTSPAEVWSLKSIVDKLDSCSNLIGQSSDGITRSVSQERTLRGIDLPTGSDLWKDIFDPKGISRPFFNEQDRTWHCSDCGTEIEDGVCGSCGTIYPELEFEDDQDGIDLSDLEDEDNAGWESEDDDQRRGDLDADLSGIPSPLANEGEEDEEEMADFIVNDDGESEDEERSQISDDDDDDDGIEYTSPPPSTGRRRGYSTDEDDPNEDLSEEEDSDTGDVEEAIDQRTVRRGGARRAQPIVLDSDEDQSDIEEVSNRHTNNDWRRHLQDSDSASEDDVEEVLPSSRRQQRHVVSDSQSESDHAQEEEDDEGEVYHSNHYRDDDDEEEDEDEEY
ncbi:unnamed protein product [Sympodiomycopsis kandeliae]